MKGKDDPSTVSDQSSGKLSSTNDAPLGTSLVQQEKLCKELYLSMGVHPTDIADTSDDDVASILEQMSRLQPRGQECGGSGDRNIEDILREAESLLDGQNLDQPRLKSGCTTSRSGSVTSGHFAFQGSAETCLGDDLHCHDSRHNSQGRKLDVTHTIQSSEIERESDTNELKGGGVGSEFLQPSRKTTKGYEAFVPSHLVGTPLEVTYKRIYDQIRKEVDGTLKPHLTGDFPDFKLSLPIPGLETPSYDFPGCFNLEQEFLEERKRCLKLKADLDWLRRQHEREVSDLRRRHEGQLNQIREELRTSHYQDPSVLDLQNEIKAQKQIISGYHQENEKMCVELKEIKERGQRDAHRNQSKKDSGAKVPVKPLEKAPPGKDTRSQLEEELRPQLEKEIRSVLEVEIRDRLEKQIRPQLESEIRPQLEREVRLALEKEVFVELEKERERAQARTQDLERQVRELEVILRKRQQTSSVLPCSPARERQLQDQLVQLEKDVGERRAAERQLQEQLRNAEEQLQERHAAASRVQAHLHAVKGKYEGLVSSLEQQLSDARQEVSDLKERALLVPPKAPSVPSVPSSASSEAGDAQDAQDAQDELQHDAKDASSRREPRGGALRRRPRPRRSQSVGEPAVGPPSASSGTSGTSGAATPSGEGHVIQVMPHQQNRPTPPAKPETHLLATIRGLQHELQTKEKEMAKLNRELSDARSTNRRLQQERQRLLNESASRPKTAPAAAAAAPPPAPDPDLEAENRGLRRDVTRLQEDLLSLHAKRVSDLTRLQAKHEEELESIVCERVNERLSDRSCEGRVAELQGQLYTQQLVIAHLKEQLKHSEHNSEEVALLKRERDQLEKSVMSLTKQVSRLKEAASPDAQRVAALQEQVDELEARHETRERKLQAIVRDLLHRQDQHDGDRGASSMSSSDAVACSCPAAVRLLHKNRDLCFYRAEMDRLLEALRELERSRKGGGPK